jgi:DNA-binding beta-propeller fold protein YncE
MRLLARRDSTEGRHVRGAECRYIKTKGDKVRTKEHPVKSASTPKGDRFVALRGLLPVQGSGALLRTPPPLAFLPAIALALAAIALSATPALALETHAFSKSFAGEGEHAMSDPLGVALDQSTSELYVVDSAHNRVEVFNASTGAFIKAFGTPGSGNGQFKEPTQVAVDNSTGLPGDVYVLDSGNERVEVLNAKGEYLGQITTAEAELTGPIMGVAVDVSGNLWISARGGGPLGNVYEFGRGGVLPGSLIFSLNPLYGPIGAIKPGLAIDSSGDLYVMSGNGSVHKLEPGGNQIAANFDSGGSEIAIDPATEDVYVDNGGSVAHFLASTDSLKDSFGAGALLAGSGIAVGPTGDVYVADSASSRVDIFAPTTLAEVSVEAATGVERTAATLTGTINPDGIKVESCEFEWGTQQGELTHTVPCSPAAPYEGTANIPVEAPLNGLLSDTTYYYRLSATDANGTNYGQGNVGPEESFTTLPAVRGLSTGPAEEVIPSAAKLTGSLSPDGTDAHYYFEYSTGGTPISVCDEAGCSEQSPCSEAVGCFRSPTFPPGTDAGSGGAKCKPPGGAECSTVPAETMLADLAANTTYHYRLVGVDSFGVTYGDEAVFTTPGVPQVDSESAEVSPNTKGGQSEATLRAQVIPGSREGHETTYWFEYGETTLYGTSVPVPAGDIGSGPQPVSVPATVVSGLKLDTTYHYRIVAENEYGTERGHDQTFTTLPAALLIEVSVSDVAATSATLNAQINPLGSETTCEFQYVTEASFQSTGYDAAVSLPCAAALGSGESNVEVNPRHLQGLVPHTVYHYRVIAFNSLAPPEGLNGPDQTFTTQGPGGFTLPDGRQWEMVSPPQKEGALIEPPPGEGGVEQAAAGGDAITYIANVPTELGVAGFTNLQQVLSSRGPGGWVTRDLGTQPGSTA